MAIHSLERKSDPRVVCGLLANRVLKQLEQGGEDKDFPVFVRNFIRLLDLYRFDTFSEHKHRGILQRRPQGQRKPSEGAPSSAMTAVRDSLREAHAEVFGARSQEDVVSYLTNIFEQLELGQPVNAADLDMARRFLQAVRVNIQARMR